MVDAESVIVSRKPVPYAIPSLTANHSGVDRLSRTLCGACHALCRCRRPLVIAALGRAEQFDYYTNPVLSKAYPTALRGQGAHSDQVGEYGSSCPIRRPRSWWSSRTTALLPSYSGSRPGRSRRQAACLVLVDKYLTFKGTSDRAVQARARVCTSDPLLSLNSARSFREAWAST